MHVGTGEGGADDWGYLIWSPIIEIGIPRENEGILITLPIGQPNISKWVHN